MATIYGGLFRHPKPPNYERIKLTLPDGDFLLIDRVLKKSKKAVILCHGLEGNSKSSYITLAAQYFLEKNYSVFAWNNRSCGGEMNRLPKLYHHASTEDLGAVVKDVLGLGFKEIYLLGYSLGGTQIMSYLGTCQVEERIKAACAVSTPMELLSSQHRIDSGLSRVYEYRFALSLKKKVIKKAEQFPDLLDKSRVRKIKSLWDFVAVFLKPVHGFSSVADYYYKASPGYCIHRVKTPVLLLNALDDPIVGIEGYPIEKAKNSKYLYIETPNYGGHCGFSMNQGKSSFAEFRAEQFFESIES